MTIFKIKLWKRKISVCHLHIRNKTEKVLAERSYPTEKLHSFFYATIQICSDNKAVSKFM